jgi:predicted ATPase
MMETLSHTAPPMKHELLSLQSPPTETLEEEEEEEERQEEQPTFRQWIVDKESVVQLHHDGTIDNLTSIQSVSRFDAWAAAQNEKQEESPAVSPSPKALNIKRVEPVKIQTSIMDEIQMLVDLTEGPSLTKPKVKKRDKARKAHKDTKAVRNILDKESLEMNQALDDMNDSKAFNDIVAGSTVSNTTLSTVDTINSFISNDEDKATMPATIIPVETVALSRATKEQERFSLFDRIESSNGENLASIEFDKKPSVLDEIAMYIDSTEDVQSPPTKEKPETEKEGKKVKKGKTTWKERLQDKLYHRSKEMEILQSCLLSSTKPSLITVTGPNGSGKTRITQAMKELLPTNTICLRGSFSQYCYEPYQAWVTAWTDYAHQVMAKGWDEVLLVQTALKNMIDSAALHLITSMVPALTCLLQSEKATDMLSCGCTTQSFQLEGQVDSLQRFGVVYRSFLQTITTVHSIVMILEDYHNADRCSWDLLTSVTQELHKLPNYMLVVTSESVTCSVSCIHDKLTNWSSTSVLQLSLDPLTYHDIAIILADMLNTDEDTCMELSSIVYDNTKGNFHHFPDFMQWLQLHKLLKRKRGVWYWDLDEIRFFITESPYTTNEYLKTVIQSLPQPVIDVLLVAACLGSNINPHLLEYIFGKSVLEELEIASSSGMLLGPPKQSTYSFEHDFVHQLIYNMIPQQERETLHLQIGRRIWIRVQDKSLEDIVFIILSQMQKGLHLICHDQERVAIATLCILAGRKAAKASAFRRAASYFDVGISILPDSSWREGYDLTLKLHNAAAECYMCVADFERMEEISSAVYKNARVFEDKLQAYATQVYALSCSDRQLDAIDLAIQVLVELEEPFPRRMCMARLLRSMKQVQCMLKGKSNEQLLRLPTLQNNQKLEALKFLQLIVLPSVVARPKLLPFVLLKTMYLTLKYGASVFASIAFSSYGMLCAGAFGEIEEGYRFGEIGMVYLERFKTIQYLPRVYAAFYGGIYAWKKPIGGALLPLMEAYKVGLMTGDIEFAALSANLYSMHSKEAGTPLGVILEHWNTFRDTMVATKQESMLRMARCYVQSSHDLMGLPLVGMACVDYSEEIKYAREHKIHNLELAVQLTRMMLSCVFNTYDTAEEDAAAVTMHLHLIPPTFERVSCWLFIGLTSSALLVQGGQKRGKYMRVLKRTIQMFKRWALICPQNTCDRLSLLEAELASVQGKHRIAHQKYYNAIALAHESNFLMVLGLAKERAARHHLRCGNQGEASALFCEALDVYERWNAYAKVHSLKMELAGLGDVFTNVDGPVK